MKLLSLPGLGRNWSLVLSELLLACALAGCGAGGGAGGGTGSTGDPAQPSSPPPPGAQLQSASASSAEADDSSQPDPPQEDAPGTEPDPGAPGEPTPPPAEPAPIPGDPPPPPPPAPAPPAPSATTAPPAPPTPELRSFSPAQTVLALHMPIGGAAVGPQGQLVVPDYTYNRVLVYTSWPTAPNQEPSFQLPALGPVHVHVQGERLVVVENRGHRVAIYNRFPVDASARPDVMVGQPDKVSATPGLGRSSLFAPFGATVTPQGQLIVAETGSHRVLLWDTVPQRDGQEASLVLGQADFSHVRQNDDNQDNHIEERPTARTMHYPTGVWSDGQRLVVSDSYNNRILVWTAMPQSSFQPADLVLGQQAFDVGAANDTDGDGQPDAVGANTLGGLQGAVASDGTRLAVADTYNHRVLVWNSFPERNGRPADLVLGQPDFIHAGRNTNPAGFADQSIAPWGLHTPIGLQFVGEGLLVTDTFNNRLQLFTPQ